MSRIMKRALAVALLLIAAATGAACAQDDGYSAIDQLDGARIGVQTGTTEGQLVEAPMQR